ENACCSDSRPRDAVSRRRSSTVTVRRLRRRSTSTISAATTSTTQSIGAGFLLQARPPRERRADQLERRVRTAPRSLLHSHGPLPIRAIMASWRRVSPVRPAGNGGPPGPAAPGRPPGGGGVPRARGWGPGGSPPRLLCPHLARVGRRWGVEAELAVARDRALLRHARRSGCRALVFGPDPAPLLREANGPHDLTRLRTA